MEHFLAEKDDHHLVDRLSVYELATLRMIAPIEVCTENPTRKITQFRCILEFADETLSI